GSRDLPYHAGFLPLLPLLTVLLASVPALMRLPAQVVIFLAAAHAVWGVVAADEERAAAVTGMVTAGREVGNWAAIRLNESEALATDTAGAVAYASARRTLSLRPGYYLPPPASDLPPPANRAEAVLQARPEIVVFRDPLHSHRPLTAADRELFDHPLFRFFYAPRRERLAEGSTVHYFALDRRDLELWPVAWQGDEDRVSDLVAAAVERWQKEPPPAPADSPEGVALHRQLEEAHAAAERGERDRVIDILEAVHQRNQTARVAGIPAAIGGIAARIEHLPLAIQGFKDQARLDPTSRVRHTHLRMFLRIKPEDLKQQ
ncbi:MAG TPA: hypothetical protein VEB21_15460, partial [Terriglobales bacterium]|nr:hypothetical protein [Terriglobales bacterium]